MLAFIFDTETTGLIANHTMKLDKQAEIIEIAYRLVDLEMDQLLGEFETFIKPYRYPMSDETIKACKTKITNDMLKDAPFFHEIGPALKKLFLGPVDCVIAHNCAFDTEIIDLEFERWREDIKWPRKICTVESTIHFRGHRLSLMDLYEHLFGEKFKDAHRAMSDVRALARIAVELFKRGDI